MALDNGQNLLYNKTMKLETFAKKTGLFTTEEIMKMYLSELQELLDLYDMKLVFGETLKGLELRVVLNTRSKS